MENTQRKIITDYRSDVKQINKILKKDHEDKSLPHAYKLYSRKPGYKNFSPEKFGGCQHVYVKQRDTALNILAFVEKWFKTTEFQIRKNGKIRDLQADVDKEAARHELNEACKLMSSAEWLQKCRFYRSGKLKNAELPDGERVILKAESTATNFRTTSKDFLLRLKPKTKKAEKTPGRTAPQANNGAACKCKSEQKKANMLTASQTQPGKIDLPSKDATLKHSDNEDQNMAKRGRPKKYPHKQHFGNVENRRPRTEWQKLPSGKMSNAEFRSISAPWMQKELAELLEVPERQITRWRSPNPQYPVPDIIAERLLALPPRPCPSVSPRPELAEQEKIIREKKRKQKISLTRKQRWEQYARENANMLTNEKFRELSTPWTARELAEHLNISEARVISYRRKVNPPRIPNDIAERFLTLTRTKA